MIREARTRDDIEAWTRVRNLVQPEEPASVEDVVKAGVREPERRVYLAELDGEVVGCAFVARSDSLPGCAATIPRVVPHARRRGMGSALLQACSDRARELGCDALSTHVNAADPDGLAFAARYGFAEVGRQVELVRALRVGEEAPVVPDGIAIERLAAEHAHGLRELVVEAAADMPVPGAIHPRVIDDWIDDLESAAAAYVAIGRDRVVGVAGLTHLSARPGRLENALTAVLRSHRRRGIGSALKQSLAVWAAASGYREIVTWTQKGNVGMQAVNERGGYRRGNVTITLRGPLRPQRRDR
jgi:GNAT superfamily N-acetyltransferase